MPSVIRVSAAVALCLLAAACESDRPSTKSSLAQTGTGLTKSTAAVEAAAAAEEAGTAELARASAAASEVEAVFADMRLGEYRNRSFPGFGWQHVDALLAMADSDEQITHYPANPFSSQLQRRCSAGILALWFVEGVRKDEPGGYPSLNPLCLSRDVPAPSWLTDSESNRPRAAEAYQAWWAAVRDATPEARRASDPLAGTGLHWY